METLKGIHPIRDAFLVVLLFILIKPALYLSAKRVSGDRSDQESFFVHEYEQTMLNNFSTVQKQIKEAQKQAQAQGNAQSKALFEKLEKEIDELEKKYRKNSPGLLFLGPLASISIVLKEEEIKIKLQELTNYFNKELCLLHEEEPAPDLLAQPMQTTLKENFTLLKRYSAYQSA